MTPRPQIHMKISITLDGIISAEPFNGMVDDDDLYCLNQIAFEQGWYAANRWFAAGHDVFFITSRTNRKMTDRWLDEWAVMYNRVIYDIPFRYQFNAAVALDSDIFITPQAEEVPKHKDPEIRTYFYSEEPTGVKSSKNVFRINNLYEIDQVIEAWPHLPKKSSVKIVGQSRTLRT